VVLLEVVPGVLGPPRRLSMRVRGEMEPTSTLRTARAGVEGLTANLMPA